MTPLLGLGALVCAAATAEIGQLIGKRAGRGGAGFWLGFFLSLAGVAVISLVVAWSPDGREEYQIRREAERMQIRQEAQRRVDAEQDG